MNLEVANKVGERTPNFVLDGPAWIVIADSAHLVQVCREDRSRALKAFADRDCLCGRVPGINRRRSQVPTKQPTGKRPAVERIATFANNARPEGLSPEVRRIFKRNILDSLGCAIAALSGQPFKAFREQFEEYRSGGTCTLIGGGKTSVDQAALFNRRHGLARGIRKLGLP